MKAGIMDPTKVARFTLQSAASAAGLLITTEAMIADKPKNGKSVSSMPSERMYQLQMADSIVLDGNAFDQAQDGRVCSATDRRES